MPRCKAMLAFAGRSAMVGRQERICPGKNREKVRKTTRATYSIRAARGSAKVRRIYCPERKGSHDCVRFPATPAEGRPATGPFLASQQVTARHCACFLCLADVSRPLSLTLSLSFFSFSLSLALSLSRSVLLLRYFLLILSRLLFVPPSSSHAI